MPRVCTLRILDARSMVPTASTQRLTLPCTCKIRTEDFLDVATSARLSVVVPTCFHVPVRAIGYYCYGHFCYEAGLTGATLGVRAQVSMLPAAMYSSTTSRYYKCMPKVSALVLCARATSRVGTEG